MSKILEYKKEILGICLVALLLLGLSFAYLTLTLKGTKTNTLVVGTLSVVLDDSTSSGISLENAIPMSDTKGLTTTAYTFTVTNNGNISSDYTIYLDDTDLETGETRMSDSYVKYSLTKNGGTATTALLPTIGTNPNRVLDSGTINTSITNTYTLRVWIDSATGNDVMGKVFRGKIRVVANQHSNVETGVTKLLAKTNPVSLTEYTTATTAQKGEMFTFSHTAGTQQSGWTTAELTDYRYIGSSPNNYVTFNGETWRIIGVFTVENSDGTKSQKIKIIRDIIGRYSWDSSASTINSGAGINEWSQADLMTELNSGAYWNRTSGTCYSGESNETTTCDFSTTGLTSTAKAMISPTKYYLGSSTGTTYQTQTATQFYGYERGTTVYTGTADGVTRTTNWIGNVALMYPSDYGYATGGGTTTNQQACLAKELYNWSDSSYSDCPTNDWLYNSSHTQWLLSPYAGIQNRAFSVSTTGYVDDDGYRVYYTYAARPVIYLKSDILVTGGDGSSSNPYTLG
jgi:hypothetical protein